MVFTVRVVIVLHKSRRVALSPDIAVVSAIVKSSTSPMVYVTGNFQLAGLN